MRLQVMYLPDETVGEVSRGRFALIVDDYAPKPVDVPDGDPGRIYPLPEDPIREQLGKFAEQIGAAGVGIFADKVEVA